MKDEEKEKAPVTPLSHIKSEWYNKGLKDGRAQLQEELKALLNLK